MKSLFLILSSLLYIALQPVHAQDRITNLEKRLLEYTQEIPELDERVDISVNGISIQELLRGIANNINLNLTVAPDITAEVVNNFNEARVMDILLFLCKEYQLDINKTGGILSIVKYRPPAIKEKITISKSFLVHYDKEKGRLSLDVSNDTLLNVVKVIIEETNQNIVLAPGLNYQKVTGYFKDVDFEEGMYNFCYSNNLVFSKQEDSFYAIDKKESTPIETKNDRNTISRSNTFEKGSRNISPEISTVLSIDSITYYAEDAPLLDILYEVSNSTKTNYSILSPIEGNKSLNVTNLNYDEFLTYLLNGTNYTFKKQNGIYLIGDRKLEDLNCVRQIPLQHRTVSNIKEAIPDELKRKVNILEFTEQNSLMLSGSMVDIEEVASFVKEIDKVVPVILIEVIIIDYSKGFSIQTGLSAGVGENKNNSKTTGSFLSGLDVNIGTETINDVLNSLNGMGWVNLGKVTPNFYLSMQALEENNYIKIHSTPKLATLNGHEASLVSGETKYYKEEQNSYYGSQNPQLEKAYSWKAINADLTVNIKPIVSGNNQVTLEIEVQQSQFTPREFDDSPPGSVTRTFKSLIRVKNNEMILLGGLDQNTTSATSRGLPLIARIPVLKWIFSTKTREKENAKLSLLIKPTIIY